MHRSGILILTHHVSSLCHGDVVKNIIAGVKKVVSSSLYVHVANTSPQLPTIEPNNSYHHLNQLLKLDGDSIPYCSQERHFASDVIPFISKFYTEASQQCRDLDVNILLHNIGYQYNTPCQLKKHVHCIIADCTSKDLENEEINSIYQKFVKNLYVEDFAQSNLPLISISDALPDLFGQNQSTSIETVTSKGSVVIGGTYDQIHSGHKVLLSESILLAHKRLLIGLTDGVMLIRKTLSDLIEPYELRKQQLADFICDIAHFRPIEQNETNHPPGDHRAYVQIERIVDPVGPSGYDDDLQCIVVSKETEKGGAYVNKVRKENGLNSLVIHVIGQGGLVDDHRGSATPTGESKSSSSTYRYELLGVLRKQPNLPDSKDLQGSYVIGLTGGIASGKSSVTKHLENLGAVTIDCDKLGHVAYEPGTEAFAKVVERFGRDVVSQDGTIDRKILASKVFTSNAREKDSNLADLNAIVWPEIERLARRKIVEAVQRNAECDSKQVVCVLDAAVLLEAGWDEFVNEVWVCLIPEDEAIRRMEERDGRSKEEAEKRIRAQITGRERVQRAHVVLSTLWEPSVTQSQVKKAWSLLQSRIPS